MMQLGLAILLVKFLKTTIDNDVDNDEESKGQQNPFQNQSQASGENISDMRYYFIQNKELDTIMLKREKFIEALLKDIDTIIWLDGNIDGNKGEKQIIEASTGLTTVCASTVEMAEKIMNEYGCYEKFTLITSLKLAKEVEKNLSNRSNIQSIVCYCLRIDHYNKLKSENILKSKFKFGTKSQNQLISHLNQKKNKAKRKYLQNFISLQTNEWKFCVQLKAMFSMLSLSFDRKEMNEYFCRLLLFLYPQQENKINKFKNDSNSELSLQKALYWYSDEGPIYRVLNNLLRTSKSISELYYSQCYFCDLFRAIKKLYDKQQKTNKNSREFECWRGGSISSSEIDFFKNNEGQNVQNLGYMSTSLNEIQAKYTFMKNVLFRILVNDVPRKTEIDYGYALIQEFSAIQSEKQVLFNPLNTFKILKVISLDDDKWQIQLRYGEIPEIVLKGENPENAEKLTESEKKYFKLGCEQLLYSKQEVTQHQLISELSSHSKQCEQQLEFFKKEFEPSLVSYVKMSKKTQKEAKDKKSAEQLFQEAQKFAEFNKKKQIKNHFLIEIYLVCCYFI